GIKQAPERRTEDFSRALIVVTVVTAALILVSAGYSDRQSAPAFGLLGTIVGYILGRMGQARGNSGDPPGGGGAVAPPAPTPPPTSTGTSQPTGASPPP